MIDISQACNYAKEEGKKAYGSTFPNPAVGAVLIKDGKIIGRGHTQTPPGSHAEIMALRHADSSGYSSQGATLIVTLEPCNHYGKTPPCAQAIIDAGIAHVIYMTADPNPLAKGGAHTLKEAGISVEYIPTYIPELEAWLHYIRTGRPYIRAKIAQSLDGYIAAKDGTSQWITSEQSRIHAHGQRARRAAIIVGTGTYIADNPRLTARSAEGELLAHQPQPIILGTRECELKKGFVQVHSIEELFSYCAQYGLYDLLLEGGAGLISSFMEKDYIDELHVYTAPIILGSGKKSIQDIGIHTLSHARKWVPVEIYRLGCDQYTYFKPNKESDLKNV